MPMQRKKPEADHTAEILAHIEQFGIARKDAVPAQKPVKRKTIASTRSRIPRMTLDLHGLRSEEAAIRLRSALHRCKEVGIGELLVIHGYGLHSSPNEGPVLKKLVHDLLDNDLRPTYRMYRTAPLKDGGEGATLVALW
jgi:DNA-nicking Smr family endonuclease